MSTVFAPPNPKLAEIILDAKCKCGRFLVSVTAERDATGVTLIRGKCPAHGDVPAATWQTYGLP